MSVTIAQSPYAYLDRNINDGNYISQQLAAARADAGTTQTAQADKPIGESDGLFGQDGFGFDDFLDIINPLQHIPVISALYREFTGDEIETGARVIGGGIFGGGLGLAAAVVNSAIEAETGKDIGGHVMAMVSSVAGGEDDADVAVGEKVEISWNSERLPANNLAEAKTVDPVILSATENVTDDAVLLKLAAQEPAMNIAGLLLKPGFGSLLPQPAAPQPTPGKAVAAYESTALLRTSADAAPLVAAQNDFTFPDNRLDP